MTTNLHKIRELAERAFVVAMERGEVTESGEAAFTHGFIAAFAAIDEEVAAIRRHVDEVERLAKRAFASSSSPVILLLHRPETVDVPALEPRPEDGLLGFRVNWSVPCSNCGMDSCEGCGS